MKRVPLRIIIEAVVLLCVIGFAVYVRTAPSDVLWAGDAGLQNDGRYDDEQVVVLLYTVDIKVNPDGSYTQLSHQRKKIQKESAKDAGELEILYDSSYQKIRNIHAYTILPGGKKLRYSEINEFAVNEEAGSYSNEKRKTITMPEVNVGSVIDLSYTKKSSKADIEGHFYDQIYLSYSEPVKVFRYSISFPGTMKPRVFSYNTKAAPEVRKKGDRTVYTWEQKNLDKDREEDFAPPYYEIWPYALITTVDDWKTVSEWFWKLISKNMAANEEIRAKVKELTRGKSKAGEKAEALVQYIRENFRYVSMSFWSNRYEPHPVTEVFKNKYGDCKDQSTLLIAMLREAGVEAWPALYAQEDEDRVYPDVPQLTYFNHVIVVFKEGDKTCYLDPLTKGYHAGEIPPAQKGAWLFVVNDKGGYLDRIPVEPDALGISHTEKHYAIKPGGRSPMSLRRVFDREDSIDYREKFDGMSADDKKDYSKELEKARPGISVLALTHSDTKDDFAPFTMNIRANVSNAAVRQGRIVLVTPDYVNPGTDFVTSDRLYDSVFLTTYQEQCTAHYRIPAGYKILELPPDFRLSTGVLEYSDRFAQKGVEVTQVTQVVWKRGRVKIAEYPQFQARVDELAQHQKNLIILEKEK